MLFKGTTGERIRLDRNGKGWQKAHRLQPCSRQGVALYSSVIGELMEGCKEESHIFRFIAFRIFWEGKRKNSVLVGLVKIGVAEKDKDWVLSRKTI